MHDKMPTPGDVIYFLQNGKYADQHSLSCLALNQYKYDCTQEQSFYDYHYSDNDQNNPQRNELYGRTLDDHEKENTTGVPDEQKNNMETINTSTTTNNTMKPIVNTRHNIDENSTIHNHYVPQLNQNEYSILRAIQNIIECMIFVGTARRFDEAMVLLMILLQLSVTDILYISSKQNGCWNYYNIMNPIKEQCIRIQLS